MLLSIKKKNMQMKLDTIFVLDDGRTISFLEDTWCNEAHLCQIFPTLCSLTVEKGAKEDDVWDFSKGEGAWIPSFVMPLNDWEMDEAHIFLCLLNSRRVKQEEKDKLFWKGDKECTYTVKANVTRLEKVSGRTAPMNMLWNSCVPPKVCFYAWEVWWGKVFTTKHLKKWGFQLANRCPLCGKAEEELNHILIHCPSV